MIDHMPELMDAGLDSLKIEGRARAPTTPPLSPGPTATRLMPPWRRPLDPVWRAELDKVSHRPYSTGFYYGGRGGTPRTPATCRDWRWWGWSPPALRQRRPVLRNKFARGDELG